MKAMKDWKKLMKQARQQGWRIKPTPRCHYKWFAPDGKTILVSGSSTSDHRGLANHISSMRRVGFHD